MSKVVLDVIGDIYEAAYCPEHWEVALKNICSLIDAKSAGLFIKTHGKKQVLGMYGYGVPKAGIFAYNHGFANIDPCFKIMSEEPAGKSRSILNPDESDFDHGVYHKLMNRPIGIHYVAGMNIFNDEFLYVGLGLHRGKEAGNFDQISFELVDDLLPHLQRAIRIQQEFTRLRMREKALTEGLSRLALGVVLLDENGYPIYVNPVAQSIFESHPAIEITPKGINAYQREQNKSLRKTIVDISTNGVKGYKTSGVTFGLKHPEKILPLTVMLSPYAGLDLDIHEVASEARVLMYLSDPDASAAISTDSLQQLYGLSDAEATIAIAIANGFTLEQITETNHVTENTVKTQLKSVFRKTNSNRQVDLVRLLLKNPQMVAVSMEENVP